MDRFIGLLGLAIIIGIAYALSSNRKEDLARLGIRAIIGGSIATFMTATIAGLLS